MSPTTNNLTWGGLVALGLLALATACADDESAAAHGGAPPTTTFGGAGVGGAGASAGAASGGGEAGSGGSTEPPVPETASAVFLWGTAETANSGFFRPAVEFAGYGPFIHFRKAEQERFAGQRSVEFYTVFDDLSGVDDPFVHLDTNQRVELHSNEPYQALGVSVGTTVWIGWSHLYDHIGLPDPFTDFQLRSQAPGVTGSPAAEFYIEGDTNELYFNAGPTDRVLVTTLEEGAWYDFVLEFKYSHDDDGYARIWAAKAGSGGEVMLSYDAPTTEIVGVPTMHNGTTFINQWADSPEDQAAVDTSPHLRWGVYPWDSSNPASLGEHYRKYLSSVRVEVGSEGLAAFDAVIPRTPVAGTLAPASLAVGKPVRTSSRYLLSDGQFAVDGHTHGEGDSSSGIAHTELEAEPFLELDLEQVLTIDRLVIWNTAPTERLDGVHVIVSAQPFASDSLDDCLAQSGVWTTSIAEPELRNELTLPSVAGRYVRLQLPTTEHLVIAEVEVF